MQDIPQQGSVAEVFLPRLIAQLHRDGFEGALRVHIGAVGKAIYFKRGEIASAASNAQEDRLQSILVEEGRLTRSQMEMARSRSQSAASLGKTLIEMGLLTPTELLECARRQVQGILASCFDLQSGTFQVDAGPLPAQITVLGLPTKRLIFDSLLRAGDRQRVVQEMGSMESVYRPEPGMRGAVEALGLEPAIDQVARSIDGTRSLRQISGETSLDDFAVSKIVLALEVLGLAEHAAGPVIGATDHATHRIIPVEVEATETAPPASGSGAPAIGGPPSPPVQQDVGGSVTPVTAADGDPPPTESGAAPIPSGGDPAPEDDSPAFPPEELSAFAVPPGEEPEWSVDPRTGERVHVGPIEMTFDGRVLSQPRLSSSLGRYIALVVVVLIAGGSAFLYTTCQSRRAAPVADAAPPPVETPVPRRSETGPGEERTTARQAPDATSPVRGTGNAERDGPAASPPGKETRQAPEPAAAASPPPVPERGISPFGSSPDYLAAVQQLDAGKLDRAAALFQRLVVDDAGQGFTLQLMIACEAETVRNVRAGAGGGGQLFILPFNFKGRSCYRPCWGVYPSREAAREALQTIPASFTAAGVSPIVISLARLSPPAKR